MQETEADAPQRTLKRSSTAEVAEPCTSPDGEGSHDGEEEQAATFERSKSAPISALLEEKNALKRGLSQQKRLSKMNVADMKRTSLQDLTGTTFVTQTDHEDLFQLFGIRSDNDDAQSIKRIFYPDHLGGARPFWVLRSTSKAAALKDLIILLLALETALVVPWRCAFDAVFPDRDQSDTASVHAGCALAFAVLGLALPFGSSHIDIGRGVEIFGPAKARILAVLRDHHFWLDLCSMFAVGLNPPIQMFELLRIWRIFHCPHFVKSRPVLQCLRILLACFLCAHIVACTFVVAAALEKSAWSDVLTAEPNPGDLYVAALYWSTYTVTSVGYGDIVPGSLLERCIAIVAMLGGTLVMATSFSNFNLIVMRSNALTSRYFERVSFVKQALTTMKVPSKLRERILWYYEYRNLLFQDIGALHDLSAPLSLELKLCVSHSLVVRAPFFHSCPPEVIKEIVVALREEICLPGDYIVRMGDPGDRMYFQSRGIAAVLDANLNLIVTLQVGAYFGEVALLTGKPRMSWIRAETYCILAELLTSDLTNVLDDFPSALASMFRRMRKVCKVENTITMADLRCQLLERFDSLEDAFSYIDSGRKLRILPQEFQKALDSMNMPAKSEARLLWAAMDTGGHGIVELDDFCKALSCEGLPSPQSPSSPQPHLPGTMRLRRDDATVEAFSRDDAAVFKSMQKPQTFASGGSMMRNNESSADAKTTDSRVHPNVSTVTSDVPCNHWLDGVEDRLAKMESGMNRLAAKIGRLGAKASSNPLKDMGPRRSNPSQSSRNSGILASSLPGCAVDEKSTASLDSSRLERQCNSTGVPQQVPLDEAIAPMKRSLSTPPPPSSPPPNQSVPPPPDQREVEQSSIQPRKSENGNHEITTSMSVCKPASNKDELVSRSVVPDAEKEPKENSHVPRKKSIVAALQDSYFALRRTYASRQSKNQRTSSKLDVQARKRLSLKDHLSRGSSFLDGQSSEVFELFGIRSDFDSPEEGQRRVQCIFYQDTSSPRPWWVLRSTSPTAATKDMFLFLLVVETFILTPWITALDAVQPTIGLHVATTVHSISVSLFVLLGIVMRFLTSFVDVTRGVEIFGPVSRLATATVQDWRFWTDIISIIPFCMGSHAPGLRIFELLRSWRLWDCPRIFKRYHVLQFARLLLACFLVAHVVACVFVLTLAAEDESVETWATAFFGHSEPFNTGELYLASLYWSTYTVTGVGYGDVAPQTSRERSVAVGAMLGGSLVMATIFSNFNLIVLRSNALQSRHYERIAYTRQALKTMRVPVKVRERIMWLYEYREALHSDMRDFADLSSPLFLELKLQVYHPLVIRAPFFHTCPPEVVKSIVVSLRDATFLPGDYVVRYGDAGDRMFFLCRGLVSVLDSDFNLLADLAVGAYFGEVALLTGRTRMSWIRASTYCVLAELLVTDLDVVLAEYPGAIATMVRRMLVVCKVEPKKRLGNLRMQLLQRFASLEDAFKYFDREKKLHLRPGDLRRCLEKLGFEEAQGEARMLFAMMDEDSSGVVTEEAFVNALSDTDTPSALDSQPREKGPEVARPQNFGVDSSESWPVERGGPMKADRSNIITASKDASQLDLRLGGIEDRLVGVESALYLATSELDKVFECYEELPIQQPSVLEGPETSKGHDAQGDDGDDVRELLVSAEQLLAVRNNPVL